MITKYNQAISKSATVSLIFTRFSTILGEEAPDALPTPQGGAQTPGYFFAQILLGLGAIGLDGAIGKSNSQYIDSSPPARQSFLQSIEYHRF
jgi:hypothetical protein